ncbi:MAG: hypothetical protein ACRDPC_00120 [Solirubrobacteraceae bacterium]
MPDPELIAAACKATILWRLDVRAAARLSRHDPPAAVRGIAEAMQQGAEWWHVIALTSHLTPEDLRNGGLDEEVIRRVEATQAAACAREKQDPDAFADAEDEPPLELAPPPNLTELVMGTPEDTDGPLLRGHRTLSGHVNDLDAQHRARLTARIAAWWPEKPYVETITWIDHGTWRQEYGSAAWLAYASALGLTVTSEQWAQVASCGVLFDPQRLWLRERSTVDGQLRAAELLAGVANPARWLGLFDCCKDPLAEPIMQAASDALRAHPSVPRSITESEDLRAREKVIGRLVANGRADLALRLAEQRPDLEASFDRKLAEHGDADAQVRLASGLVARAADGESLVHEDFGWMDAVADERLLGPLFELLGLVWRTSDKPVPRVSSGSGLHDVTNPVMAAIKTVGGRAAIDGYDELLARGGDMRWLRHQREEIAASALRMDGLEAAEAAAAEANIPVLPVVAENDPV